MKVLVFPVLLGVAVYTARVEPPKPTHWAGTISNGAKGATVSFDVASDGKSLSNVAFQGNWRCGGKMEQTATGSAQTFPIRSGRASGVVAEPADGGSIARHFEFDGNIGEDAAQGTFRVNNLALGCDTEPLQWTAAPAQ